MPKRQLVYLLLSAVGLALTWYHNLAFVRTTGSFALDDFLRGVFANHASSSIGFDILIAAAAFLTFVVTESKRLGMKRAWIWFVLTFGIAFAFAAPLFLFARERALSRETQS